MEVMLEFLGGEERTKRTRPKASDVRARQGDPDITRNFPQEERKNNDELLQIGLESRNQRNKDRWRLAPYFWNEKGFLYGK